MNCCRFGAIATFAALLLALPPAARTQKTLTISSWGGAFQKAQKEAWFGVVEKELASRSRRTPPPVSPTCARRSPPGSRPGTS